MRLLIPLALLLCGCTVAVESECPGGICPAPSNYRAPANPFEQQTARRYQSPVGGRGHSAPNVRQRGEHLQPRTPRASGYRVYPQGGQLAAELEATSKAPFAYQRLEFMMRCPVELAGTDKVMQIGTVADRPSWTECTVNCTAPVVPTTPSEVHTAESLWSWTPPAEYHAAACKVNGGSGLLIWFGDMPGVITCKHCISGRHVNTVVFSDGHTETVAAENLFCDKHGHDIAFLIVDRPELPHLPIAGSPFRQGDYVEALSRVPESNDLRTRHYATTYIGDGKVEAPIVPGDSGGGYLTAAHEVAALSAAGQSPQMGVVAQQGSWQALHNGRGPQQPEIAAFLTRVAERCPNCPRGTPYPEKWIPPAGAPQQQAPVAQQKDVTGGVLLVGLLTFAGVVLLLCAWKPNQ